jgi:hypothetical protein
MAILAKAFPAKIKPDSESTLSDLEPKYKKWEQRLNFVYLLCWIPTTTAIWLTLKSLSDWHAQLLPAAQFKITTGSIFWLIPSFFLALAISVIPASWIAKKWLGPFFHEYEIYYRLKHAFDVERVNRLAYWFVGCSSGVAIFLGLNWYILVNANSLVVNPIFSTTEREHLFTDIESIQTAPRLIAPNGNVVSRREFLIRFRGGHDWTTMNLPTNLRLKEKRNVVQFISKSSGIHVDEISVFTKDAL